MSDADLADAMCSAASEEKPQAAASGANRARCPAPRGGYLAYATDEAGDFQIATGAGQIAVVKPSDGSGLEVEKNFKLNCHGLGQGYIVELEKEGQYILALTGFETATTPILIGPAGGHHHHEGDPHFWLDPVNVIKYTENIRDGLSQADPGGAATYARNADAYIAKLKDLDAWISEQVKQISAERRLLVTNHESWLLPPRRSSAR
ncbi:MAG: zinc ABC transporter substrate-binding protein [Anaerolineae bacterium]|uniref:metal ABC transporter substrate-binding protein n=1 Tax=Candidatus Amarolinea dominans TaxID=3140696 RepID=UPI0031365E29|nr:zinc ABC transporter substrate-binding protein [Anaerolineae bacterium]